MTNRVNPSLPDNIKLKNDKCSLFSFDRTLRRSYPIIAGIDEAGRGPLAGPVVAASVILPDNLLIPGLRDSKLIQEKKRLKLFWDIVFSAEDIGIGIVDHDIIDSTNILRATRLAMEEAINDLCLKPDILLIDAAKLPNINHIPQKSIIKGDSISASIAAASIIAKTVRDNIMHVYHTKFPQYNFKKHKGYPTKEHIKKIERFGPCSIHRKSFRRVINSRFPLTCSLEKNIK
jgi:ribonuclease HII